MKQYKCFFQDVPLGIRRDVNPYLSLMEKARQSGTPKAIHGRELKNLKGHWKSSQSNNASRLVLEIGCHNGELLCQMAKAEPNAFFVGLDITYKRVYVAAKRADDSGLTNVTTLLADARFLPLLFEKGEIDDVILFFPDPWVKKNKTKHNRLLDQEFCCGLSRLLNKNSRFYFRSDSFSYYEMAQHYLKFAGFHKKDMSFDNIKYKSYYHKFFLKENAPIYEGCWTLQSSYMMV